MVKLLFYYPSDEYISYFKSYNDFGINDGNVVVFRTDSSDLDVIPGYVMVKFDLNGGVVWKKNINDYYNKNLYYVVDNKVDSIFYIKNSSLEKKELLVKVGKKIQILIFILLTIVMIKMVILMELYLLEQIMILV